MRAPSVGMRSRAMTNASSRAIRASLEDVLGQTDLARRFHGHPPHVDRDYLVIHRDRELDHADRQRHRDLAADILEDIPRAPQPSGYGPSCWPGF